MYNPGSDNYSESRIISFVGAISESRPSLLSERSPGRDFPTETARPCGWAKHDMSRYNVSLSRITIGMENAMTDCSPCHHSPIRGQVNRCRKHYLIRNNGVIELSKEIIVYPSIAYQTYNATGREMRDAVINPK